MVFFVCLVAKRVGKRTIQITFSLTSVCFSLWVLICFKFLGLVFSCGFDDFFHVGGFSGGYGFCMNLCMFIC